MSGATTNMHDSLSFLFEVLRFYGYEVLRSNLLAMPYNLKTSRPYNLNTLQIYGFYQYVVQKKFDFLQFFFHFYVFSNKSKQNIQKKCIFAP